MSCFVPTPNSKTLTFLYHENFISFVMWAKYELSWLFRKTYSETIDQSIFVISPSGIIHTIGNSGILENMNIVRTF